MNRRDLLLLAAVAALPLLSLVGHPGAALGDPSSELPIKLWVYETFPHVGWLGGVIDSIAYPTPGPLNNPDPVGTLVTLLARPALGRLGAVNLLVWLQLLATMAATAALALEVTRHRGAALFAAVVFGLTPLTLAYSVSSAVTDMLNLWPYPLALRSGLRALHRTGWGDALRAGAWLGAGVVSCPYNALVFSILAVPILPFLPLLWRHGPTPRPSPGPGLDQLGRAVAGIALGTVLVAGGPTLMLRGVTTAESSLLSAEEIALTRHAPPYLLLEPGGRDRYTAYLADYLAVGKDALVVRDNASRYYRAFSPGLVLLAAAVAGLALHRRRAIPGLWIGAAAFAVLASIGPFLPLTGMTYVLYPLNLVWVGLHALWPGADLLLEPFRYGLAAALGLAIAGALGIEALCRRLGDGVAPVATALWLAELVVVSPVPVPLPVTELASTAGWDALDTALPPGPILALPFYELGSDLFNRRHFVEQLTHGRPIPDHVLGFVPRYLQENQFTASLLVKENTSGRQRAGVTDRSAIPAHRRQLARDGFVGVVVDPRGYQPDALEGVLARLGPLGPPTRVGGLYVFPLR